MTATVATCLHCLTPLASERDGAFCCAGCRIVYGLLHTEHLDRYYALRGDAPGPAAVGLESGRRDRKWIDAIDERRRATEGLARIDLDVQGMHCTACVWLMREVFRRQPGAGSILVNPAVGRVHLTAAREFDLRAFVESVERFGYAFGPPLKSERRASNDLVWRMGVCVAIAMNTMIFAVAIYAGLTSGALYEAFQRINIALSFVSIAVGGSVFVFSAARALRRGVLNLDLPIALGIVLAFAGSIYSYVAARGTATFVDTLNVFIALMLVGRWLQQRVLERNRLELLASDGVDGLLARRYAPSRVARVETVRCTSIDENDVLLLAPGDLVPVDCVADRDATFSLDWINGESAPRTIRAELTIPAGAFYGGDATLDVRARTKFAASPLVELLRAPLARDTEASAKRSFWQRFATFYVAGVLVAAALGFALWLVVTHDPVRAAEVATAVLIVTCPCAFGIATPIAYDLVAAGLRRAGLYVRTPGFLERAADVRRVVFDKTGTLTTGALAIDDESPIDRLSDGDRSILYALASRSHHPKSVAIRTSLEAREIAPIAASVRERAGLGAELVHDGRRYRLGAPAWAGASKEACDLAFGVDGTTLGAFRTSERLRPDAAREVHALRGEGLDVWLLSGDTRERARAIARASGIDESHAVGDAAPEGKRAWIEANDRRDTLMVGDGINDSLAVERAFCSGTPAIDRPFMAARSDFYFVSPGLRPIRLALAASRALARVRTRNLCIALAYNAIAIALAYAGLMSPLVCAVLMPISSLSTIAATTASLNARSRVWRS